MMPASQSAGAVRSTHILLSLMVLLVASLFGSRAEAQLTGTRNVPGDYADLAAAIADLNTVGVGAGGVTINLIAANPQTAPAGGYAISLLANTSTPANPVTIEGNGNTITASAAHTVGNLNDALFKIIGSDSVTIRNFSLTENAANTVTAAGTNNMTEWGIAMLYATTTDGAHNAVLVGNTIDLNRTYQNTFGVYANSTHTATAPTTSATATTPAGSNTGLRVRGNNITDVNIGIVVVGPTAAADHNDSVEIGGAIAGQGNSITNFGTTATFSGYANVSGSVNGILVRNSRNIVVQGNSVASSAGAVTSGTLRGVYVVAASNAPTGTFSQSINNNSISVRSGAPTGNMGSLVVEAGAINATTTLNISANIFNSTGHTVASTGVVTIIAANVAAIVKNINGNTFDNLTINTTGNLTLINNSVSSPANAVINVNNNIILTALNKTGAGGTLRGYDNFGASLNAVTEINNGNNFSNITATGATTLEVWRSADGPVAGNGPKKTVTNNVFTNIAGGSAAVTVLRVAFSDTSVGNNNVAGGNTVSTVTGAAAVNGIIIESGNHNLVGNTVNGLTSSGAGTVAGISVIGTGTVQNVSRNKVYDLAGNNAGSIVNGLLISNGTTVNVDNNLIGNLLGPAIASGSALFGIEITGGGTINLAFNTVRLSGAGGAGFGGGALRASTTPVLNLRGNNLVNLITPNGAGQAVAFRRTATTLTSYGSVSNSNNYFAGVPGPSNLIYADGTNSDQTLAAFQARVASRDSASVTESPNFLSTAGVSAQFLHIDPAIATQLESAAATVAGITLDFDGDLRNASTPDIGADEFAGIVNDITAPAIGYAAFVNTTLLTNRNLAANIVDASGVAFGALAPRVYFRKNAGAYFSTPCTGSSPAYTCTIDNALLGGVMLADVVDYFVIAQDSLGNVGALPAAGLVAANVNTVTTPPTLPNSYAIVAAFPAVVNVGAAETITSLTNAGGLFAALNAGILVSDVVVSITSDLAAETGTVALNQFTEEGAGAYTLTIRPDSATERLIAGVANGGLIRFNGADRVRFDGRFAGAGKFLRVRNSGVSGPSFTFLNDATLNVVRSSFIESSNTVGTSGTILFGVSSGVLGNSGNQILDADIRDLSSAAGVAVNAVYSSGSPTAPNGSNTIDNCNVFNWTGAGVLVEAPGAGNAWMVNQNSFFQTAARTTAMRAIAILGGNGQSVLDNSIGGGAALAGGAFLATSSTFRGINLAVGSGAPSSVQGNTVKNIRSTVTGFTASYGIFLEAGRANIGTIAPNQIGSADPAQRYEINGDSAAIRVISTSSVDLHNNSVNNFGTNATPAAGQFYFGILVEGAGGTHTVINNSVSNVTNASAPDASFDSITIGIRVLASGVQTITANSVRAVGSLSVAPVAARNNRVFGMVLDGGSAVGTLVERNAISDLFASSPTIGARADVVIAVQVAALSNATLTNNMISLSGGAASDRALFGITDLNAAGAGANYQYNSVHVFGTATTANNSYAFVRFGVGAVTLRNNIFANTRAGGGFHVALANGNSAATGWPATASNFNLLWNTVPANLTQWLGTAPANNLSLAGFQAASGGDVNSLSGDPLFLTSSDLHIGVISPAVNVGTPIGGVTVDFDNDPRTAPAPEIGADELVDPNTAPGITPTAGGITRQQDSPASNSQIAVVSDTETAAGSLVVTTTSVPAGITVSNIVNTAGVVTADAATSCAATIGANLVGLRVTDAGAPALFTDANLTVNVTANTAPVLGTYPASNATTGIGTTVTPNVAPSDNGSIASITASAPGFTGSFSVNTSSGVVTVTNPGPAGVYVVTVTATDGCAQQSTTTFQLTVSNTNAAPVITPGATLTRQRGSAATSGALAAVTDDTPAQNVVVTAQTVPAGLTVTGITNTAGAITGNVAASCTATLGNNTVVLRATDPGALFSDGNLTVDVTANTAVVQGVYPATSVAAGASTTVTPDAAPTDNGSITSITAAAPGFTGSFSVNTSTGVVTITNAGPGGVFTVTVTATDNCSTTSTRTFTLTVNALPTIVAASVTLKAGDLAAVRTIANVSDNEDPENTLAITINGGATASSNGVTVGSIAVDAGGIVTANVLASCSATDASFTLRVTDSGSLFRETTLNTVVTANTAPLLSYGTTTLPAGTGVVIGPSTGPTDSGVITSIAVQSAGTFFGGVTVAPSGNVTLTNAAPDGSHTLTIRATDNCGATTDAALLVNVLADTLFANGFEDVALIAAKMRLPLGEEGVMQSLVLPLFELQDLAGARDLVNVVEFEIGSTRTLLQVQGATGYREMRLLHTDSQGTLGTGAWMEMPSQAVLLLQWRALTIEGLLQVQTALKVVED